MLTMCWSFSACAKGGNPSNNQSQTQQPGDSGNGGENQPEEIVLLSFGDIIGVGKNLGGSFLNGFVDDENMDLVDSDIISKKALFLSASEMIGKVSEFDNIRYEMVLSGEKLEGLESDLPEQVNKFTVLYSKDELSCVSKVDIRILLAYTNLDVTYNYDFYNFVIETNQKDKTVSLKMSIEKSKALGGNNSSARYEVLEVNADLNNLSNIKSYKLFGYERSIMLTSYAAKDIYNAISKYSKSEFDGINKYYMNVNEGDVVLRNANSNAYSLVVDNVSNLGQCVRRLQMSSSLKTINGFSNAIISCIGF